MPESLAEATECLGIMPYQFEPTEMSITTAIVKTMKAILMKIRRVSLIDLVTPHGALAGNVLQCLEWWNIFATKK